MLKFQSGLLMALTLLGCASAGQAANKIQPLNGAIIRYQVQKGDTLAHVARRSGLTRRTLMRANHLKRTTTRLKPGSTLLLPLQYVLPRHPQEGIVLNIPAHEVYLFGAGQVKARYPVAVGKPNWQTAQGTFTLRNKKVNPTWRPTKSMVEREDIKDDPVGPGRENPLGDRWMGWSKPGFGFHSTNAPMSVGTTASHGCVRLYPESARAMFERVKPGMTIYSVYEPVLVGQRDGKLFLTVFPDIYHQGVTTLPHVQKILTIYGIADKVDAKAVKQTVQAHDGLPHRIALTPSSSPPLEKTTPKAVK